MSSPMSVLEALGNTKKGQLQYDRDWESEGRVQVITLLAMARCPLLNCSSFVVYRKLSTTSDYG